MKRFLRLESCILIFLAAVAAGCRKSSSTQVPVTFSAHIAPLVFKKCAPCHRPGEAGPFSLLTFADVHKRGAQIKKVTASRFMPPWKPVAGHGAFANDRSLTQAEIDLFARWADTGATEGDPSKTPATPTWSSGWQLGKPDLIVTLPQVYELSAEGRDVYRNFVLQAPSNEQRFVAAWEFRADSSTIHHAIVNIDRNRWARTHTDRAVPPGFDGMDSGHIQSPDGFYLVWTPGKQPITPSESASWRLDPQTDLVLQLHMQPTGKPEQVRPTIGLYFAKSPPTETRYTFRMGDRPLDIPPGERNYTMTDHFRLPAPVQVLSLFPHAHYLGRTIRAFADLPNGQRTWLLKIDDWDFNWQDEYVFTKPLELPAGTNVTTEFVYDNTAENPRNPNNPIRRVQTGERSSDEMGNITFALRPQNVADIEMLRASKYQHALESSDGENPRTHYNLANRLMRLGRIPDAIVEYRKAIKLDPDLSAAQFNLGNALVGQGDVEGALICFKEALRSQPVFIAAQVNLANALASKGEYVLALSQYEKAVASDPKSALAHNSLADYFFRRRDFKLAVAHFEKALALDANNVLAHFEIGQSLQALGKRTEARVHLERALALNPAFEPARAALNQL